MSRNTKVLYESSDCNYRASCTGEMNAEKVSLRLRINGNDSKYREVASLFDHGNGVSINAENIQIELDYSQLADFYYLIDAHHRSTPLLFGDYVVTQSNIPSRIRKASKKRRKKK